MSTHPAIARYEAARKDMEARGIPIPPQVLRHYCDAVRAIRRASPGLHTKVIVITRDSSAKMLSLFRTDEVKDNGVEIEVRS